MSVDSQVGVNHEIREYIAEDPDVRGPQVLLDAEFATFWGHIEFLADNRTVPNIQKGVGNVSIVGFFSDPNRELSPINSAALSLVPDIKWRSGGSHHESDKIYLTSGLSRIETAKVMSATALDAARNGNIYEFLVEDALNLGRYANSLTLPYTLGGYNAIETESWRRDTPVHYVGYVRGQFGDLTNEHEERSVQSIEEMAKMIDTNGYQDFLDYLVDFQGDMIGRVGNRFDELYEDVL